jgi:hypothetical protein
MKCLYQFVIILWILIGGALLVEAQSAPVGHYGPYSVAFPSHWKPLSSSGRVVTYTHPDAIATINITTYTFAKAVTLNALKAFHALHRYDGWEVLLNRPGSRAENERANVSESNVTVYSQPLVSEGATPDKAIAGEYYFFTPPRTGVVVSILSSSSQWSKIQSDIRPLINSFKVQSRVVPKGSSFNFSTPLHVVATLNSGVSTLAQRDTVPPIQTGESLVYFKSGQLVKRGSVSGNIEWQFSINTPISSLSSTDELILYVTPKALNAKLDILFASSGRIFRSIELSSRKTSTPVIDGRFVYMIDDTVLKKWDIFTGQLVKQFSGSYASEFKPVIGEGVIYAVTTDFTLEAITELTQNTQTYALESPPAFDPVMNTPYVIIPYKTRIDRLSLHSLEPASTYELSLKEAIIKTPLSVTDSLIVFGVKFLNFGVMDTQHRFAIVGVNLLTGKEAWIYPFSHLPSHSMSSLLVNSQCVFLTEIVTGKQVITALNTDDGTPIQRAFIPLELNPTQTIQTILASNGGLAVFTSEKPQSRLFLLAPTTEI